ncbi:MAG: hypothetical protein K2I81_01555 [Alphaproteobacteria bacterium]|nr:hypothetical protein [Alphaproteobacteria bacterium]
MKPFAVLAIATLLTACGAIGIGSNHETIVYNNSTETISVSSDSGIFKIKPADKLPVQATDGIAIKNPNDNCPQPIITRRPNSAAIFFDIFPGIILGIVPLAVDAITNNLYKMPKKYTYACME